jgi:hypothetical protein
MLQLISEFLLLCLTGIDWAYYGKIHGIIDQKKGLMQTHNLMTARLLDQMNVGLLQMDLVQLPVENPWKVKTPPTTPNLDD